MLGSNFLHSKSTYLDVNLSLKNAFTVTSRLGFYHISETHAQVF